MTQQGRDSIDEYKVFAVTYKIGSGAAEVEDGLGRAN